MVETEKDSYDVAAEAFAGLLGRWGEGAITGASGLAGKAIEAAGRVAEGIATNADPVSQVAAIVGALLALSYFCNTEPYKTVFHGLRLDGLCSLFRVPGAGPDKFRTDVGNCITHIKNTGLPVPDQLYAMQTLNNAFDIGYQINQFIPGSGAVVHFLESLIPGEGLAQTGFDLAAATVTGWCDAYVKSGSGAFMLQGQALNGQWKLVSTGPDPLKLIVDANTLVGKGLNWRVLDSTGKILSSGVATG